MLIYFDAPARKEILKAIQSRMVKGGCLMLGTAEMHPGMDTLFERRDLSGTTGYIAIYRRETMIASHFKSAFFPGSKLDVPLLGDGQCFIGEDGMFRVERVSE